MPWADAEAVVFQLPVSPREAVSSGLVNPHAVVEYGQAVYVLPGGVGLNALCLPRLRMQQGSAE